MYYVANLAALSAIAPRPPLAVAQTDGRFLVYEIGDAIPAQYTERVSVVATKPALRLRPALIASGINKIGFNYFSLLLDLLNGVPQSTVANNLAYVASTGANMVRVAYPVVVNGDYSKVFDGTPPLFVTEQSFKPSFISAVEAMFALCEAAGVKLYVCMFWWQTALPAIYGETVVSACSPASSSYRHMQSHAQWFARKYRSRVAAYSIGNEWDMGDGTTAPTAATLALCIGGVASAIRAVDADHVITADMHGPRATTLALNRESPEDYLIRMRTIFAELDAWCIHLYANDSGYVGRSTQDGANVGATASNLLGFEATEAVLSALRGEADKQGVELIIGEFGVPTDVEPDSSSLKSLVFARQVAKWAHLGMWWNVQNQAVAGANQTKWFIEPGTTRWDKFSAVTQVYQGVAGPTAFPKRGGFGDGNKIALAPGAWVRHVKNTQGRISFVSDANMAAGSTMVVLMWLKLSSSLEASEIIAWLTNGSTNGVSVLAQTTPANAVYASWFDASGANGNTVDYVPPLQTNRPYHLVLSFQNNVSAGNLIDVWVDGVLFRTGKPQRSGMVPPVDGQTCWVGGNTSIGANVLMQDFCIAPYASPEDIYRHMAGEVLPQAEIHIRAGEGGVVDASRRARPLTVGTSVLAISG